MARSRSAFSAGTSAVLHVADSALSHSTAGGGRGEGDPARWSSWPSVGSSCHVGERGRTRANLGGPPIRTRDNSRDPAACTQSRGAVWAHRRRPMGYPAPLGRRTLRRVARAAQHRRVRDVERRTARGERHDVVDGQVGGGVGGASERTGDECCGCRSTSGTDGGACCRGGSAGLKAWDDEPTGCPPGTRALDERAATP